MGAAKDLTIVRVQGRRKVVEIMEQMRTEVGVVVPTSMLEVVMVVERRGTMAARGKIVPGTKVRATVMMPLIGEAARKKKSTQHEPTGVIQSAAKAMQDIQGLMMMAPRVLQAIREGKAMHLGPSVTHIQAAAMAVMEVQELGMEIPVTTAKVLPMAEIRTRQVDGDQAILLLGVLRGILEAMTIQNNNLSRPA